MTDQIIIGQRFHGPSGSGNGGYSCGLLARFIDGPARIRLRIPPPLDQPLDVHRQGADVQLFCRGELVATGKPVKLNISIPVAPDFESASNASTRYRGHESHFYPSCFVCGPQREQGDGLRIFAGPLAPDSDGAAMVAAAWIPDESLANESGTVSDEYLWAALDCPGAYSFREPDAGAILLGELAVEIRGSVVAGEKCVLIGWEISHQGRKHFTGTALFGENGQCRAVGQATWIEVPEKPGA